MDLGRIAASVIIGLFTGFVAYLLLLAVSFPTMPWSLLVGVLFFVAYLFSGWTFPIRR
jgi:hypothetical protein